MLYSICFPKVGYIYLDRIIFKNRSLCLDITSLKTLLPLKRNTFIFMMLIFCSGQFSCSVVSDSAPRWTAAHQASHSITNSRSLFKFMSIESVMPSNHLILCRSLLLPPSVSPSMGSFQMSQCFVSGDKSFGVLVSVSVLPVNIPDRFLLG